MISGSEKSTPNEFKPDIADIHDIERLVDTFYAHVVKDPLIGPIFTDQAKVDWEKHLPIMYRFWSSILLGSRTYQGQPFPKHMPFDLQKEHFAKWLDLFFQTLDDLYAGPVADHAKYRAKLIADIFQSKFDTLRSGEYYSDLSKKE